MGRDILILDKLSGLCLYVRIRMHPGEATKNPFLVFITSLSRVLSSAVL